MDPAERRVGILRFRSSWSGFEGERGTAVKFLRGISFGRLVFLRANFAFNRGDVGMHSFNRFVGGALSSNILMSIVIEGSKRTNSLRLFHSFDLCVPVEQQQNNVRHLPNESIAPMMRWKCRNTMYLLMKIWWMSQLQCLSVIN